jgi:hypothetical protein
MTTTQHTEAIQSDHIVVKRLGSWTRSNFFQVRARQGTVIPGLRSPEIAGDIELDIDLQHAVLTLLVTDDASIDHWDLRFSAKGRVTDGQAAAGGRRIRLAGAAAGSQIRVRRGGLAELTAMSSRDYLRQMHRNHR